MTVSVVFEGVMGLSQFVLKIWPPSGSLEHCLLGALLLVAVCCLELLQLSPWLLVLIALFAAFTVQQADFIHRSYLTLDRDLKGLALLIKIRLDMRRRMRENRGIHELFLDVVRIHPDKTCIIDMSSGSQLTFAEFNAMANQFANHFRAEGFRKGDVIALFMENCAEFVAAWIGLAKIGVITAWINSNLRMDSLAHCLRVSECRAILCTDTLRPVLASARKAANNADLGGVREYSLSSLREKFSLASDGLASPLAEEPAPDRSVDFRSLLCFIYTSGTTGMPKPACIKHFRYYSMVTGIAESFGLRADDRLYISMPLYHTAAGIIGVGQVLLRGCSATIRQRFSASNFWGDCVKFECTASQYIGEICRYLLAQPPGEGEKRHKVRLMFGNGLRAEIWREFVERFSVKIGEVYGSTEGTSNLLNIDGKVGACGFLPISPLTKLIHPVRLVKLDENGEIKRQPNGLAVACCPGQTGAMVSTIRPNNPLLVFDGYLNQAETKKKVISNVFRKGDSAFLTGDILHWDRLGYLYFCIRTGDTFRFKGENVSTAEVEAVLLPLKCIIDAVVYGVRVRGLDGACGMAALVKSRHAGTDEEFLREVGARLRNSLPPYAIPRFVRICSAVDKTGTFKLVKTNLQRLGLGGNCAGERGERLFLMDPISKEYRALDEKLRAQLEVPLSVSENEGENTFEEKSSQRELLSRVFA